MWCVRLYLSIVCVSIGVSLLLLLKGVRFVEVSILRRGSAVLSIVLTVRSVVCVSLCIRLVLLESIMMKCLCLSLVI